MINLLEGKKQTKDKKEGTWSYIQNNKKKEPRTGTPDAVEFV